MPSDLPSVGLVAAVLLSSASMLVGGLEASSSLATSSDSMVDWPVQGSGPWNQRRAHVAATAGDVAGTSVVWAYERDWYGFDGLGASAIGDLGGPPGREVVVASINDTGGPGMIAALGADGSELWRRTLSASPTTPLIADLHDAPGLEVFVSHGRAHSLIGADGSTLWSTETDTGAPHATARSLPTRAPGSEAPSHVLTTLYPVEGSSLPDLRLEPVEPRIVVLNGRSGVVDVSHELPCGRSATPAVLARTTDGDLMMVGCVYYGGPFTPGSTIEAIRMVAANPTLTEKLLVVLGLRQATPWEAHVVWSVDVGGEDATLFQLALGEFHPPAGLELVVAWALDETRYLSIFSLDGSHLFTHPYATSDRLFNPTIAVGDLSGDGMDEVVLARPGARVVSILSPRADSLDAAWEIGPVAGPDGLELLAFAAALADVDGDGALEIVSTWQGRSAAAAGLIQIHDAGGGLLWEMWFPSPDVVLGEGQAVWPARGEAIADLDDDGALDIVWPAFGAVIAFEAPSD